MMPFSFRQSSIITSLLLTLACPLFAQTTAQITVDSNQKIFTVPPMAVGVNTAVWNDDMNDPAVAKLLKAAGVTALRYPGGSYSDIYHWQNNTALNNTPNPNDNFDHFMAFAKQVGASPIITANYGSNIAGNGGGDPAEAAAWVHYANVTQHYGVKYWEIGNEIYGNGEYGANWEKDLHASHTPTTYGQNVVAYADAMKKEDPSIQIGAVLTAPGAWPDGNNPDWDTHVLAECGKKIGFVIVHWYAEQPPHESDKALLSSTSSIAGMVTKVHSLINEYCGDNASKVKIFVTETNSVAYNPGKQSVSLVNGLFAADDVLQWLVHGVANVDWWDMENGGSTNYNNSSSLYGTANFGDYGLFSNGSGPEPPRNTPFSSYYGLLMVHDFTQPGDQLVSAQSSEPLVAAYASTQPKSKLAVLLINKSPDSAISAQIILNGFTPSRRATTDFYGEGSTAITSGTTPAGSELTVSLPAYSMTVLRVGKM